MIFLKLKTIVLLLCVVLATELRAQDLGELVPRDGVLVLHNGYILRGRITPLGDQYLVTMGGGDEVRIDQAKVDTICASLEDAYLQKRDKLTSGDASRHIALAQWCLRHELYHRAADQVLAALLLDPANPAIGTLERRLEAVATPAEIATGSREGKQAEADTDSALAMSRATPEPTQISALAGERFTSVVQPLLLNRCATNACHGSLSESDFKLLRPAVGMTVTSRLTTHNLNAALRYVDRARPETSPLLVKPTGPHGNLPASLFGPSQGVQIETLIGWIREVATSSRSTPVEVRRPKELALQNRTVSRFTNEEPTPPRTSGEPQDARPGSKTESGDPYDPSEYNRRYFREPANSDAKLRGFAAETR